MLRTAEIPIFTSAPVGRALLGPTWVYFCARPDLFGIVLWGNPGAEDMEMLVRALRVELRDDIPPHRSIVDASRLGAADLGAFEVLNRYVVENRDALSHAVTRLALVRPEGMVGAMTAGFYEVLERPYPIEIVQSAADGMAWLGEAPALLTELDAIVRDVQGTSVAVEQLRAWLDVHLRDGDLAKAARALGVSGRTLQRRLRSAGTTFAAEQLASRLRVAQRQMRHSDAPLSVIALETGFSSQQHFSTAFRKATGEQPSAWRARNRPLARG